MIERLGMECVRLAATPASPSRLRPVGELPPCWRWQEGEVVVQNVAEGAEPAMSQRPRSKHSSAGMVVGEWNSKNPDKVVKACSTL